MNELDKNPNMDSAAEERKGPVYSAKFIMNKELYYDFCSVSYNKIKHLFLISLCLIAYITVLNFQVGAFFTFIATVSALSLLLVLTYLRTNKAIKIGYERNLLSSGNNRTLKVELLEDRIVTYVDELNNEYSYSQISKFFETKHFILLHIQHNVHVTIEKSNLNASVDEMKSFLAEKCTNVSKKKFIDCSNDKRLSFMFLMGLLVLCVVGIAASLFLNYINQL